MSSTNGIIERIDNFLNPIIVKELRQVVRGKFFWGVLVLFLGFQCAVLSLSLADRNFNNVNSGAETLTFLFGILFLGCFALIPLYSGFRFAKERGENTEELLFITTITPHSIIGGKFAAAMAFVLLIFSAFAPFMAMTFFLSGVDLPLLFLILMLGLLICAAGTMLQLALGSLARDGHIFNLLRGGGLFIQISLFFTIIGTVNEILRFGANRTFGEFFNQAIVTAVFFIGGLIYLLYLGASAVVSPPGTNIMLPVRKFLTRFWIISLVTMIYWASLVGVEILFAWGFTTVLIMQSLILIAVSERDYLTRRVARELPKGILARRIGFLMSSGAAGGLLWSTLMIVLTVVAVTVLSQVFGMASHMHSLYSGFFKFSFGFTAYTLGYALLSVFIRRVFLHEYISIRNTWVIALVVFAVFSIAPMFLGVFIGTNSELLMIGNPFSISSSRSEELGLVFSLLISIIGIFVNAPWFARQIREFHDLAHVNFYEPEAEKSNE